MKVYIVTYNKYYIDGGANQSMTAFSKEENAVDMVNRYRTELNNLNGLSLEFSYDTENGFYARIAGSKGFYIICNISVLDVLDY